MGMEPARSPVLSARSFPISSTSGPRTNTQFPPLSSHGMPKEPSLLSPSSLVTRPHRFSGLPPSPRPSEPPMSPMPALSPSMSPPMSPPTSARSFGTLIESEPSTPAYSPHMGSNWDGSTLVLLPPIKSDDAGHHEPVWDMVPLQQPPKKRFSRHKPKTSISKANKDMAANAPLTSPPVVSIQEEGQDEKTLQADEEQGKKDGEEQSAQHDPLGRLASRMKSLLKRRSNGEKKEKRQRYELDRVETVHWTEL